MQSYLEQRRASGFVVPQYNPVEQLDRPEPALSEDALARAGGKVTALLASDGPSTKNPDHEAEIPAPCRQG
jgi:hypothetical protein